eukprot:CAMPEP_0171906848 /NCGR_PEP_ID=MMETSP0993-20121228/6525_1 /TAXON_ID=483369 /ORGANISM="non described non described, Strain CCMP2098" /LENGTH=75 /DNA_ID=CAMNT_0012538923 /DNA_START=32 /DNA_END=259 /DNA_ORIENTATION=+
MAMVTSIKAAKLAAATVTVEMAGQILPTFGLAPRGAAIQTAEFLLLRLRTYLAFLYNYTSGRSYWHSHFYNGLLH